MNKTATTQVRIGDGENGKAGRRPWKMPRLQLDSSGEFISDDPTQGGIDPRKNGLLGFSDGNAKLKHLRPAAAKKLGIPVANVKILTLTLPAGWSCPGANECLAFADPATGRIWDSPTLKFRCFAASAEARPTVRNLIWHNFNLLRRAETQDKRAISSLISDSVIKAITDQGWNNEKNVVIIRIHVGGDFYSKSYLQGWSDALATLESLPELPKVLGYAYTKSLHHLAKVDNENIAITASRGGRYDSLADDMEMKQAIVLDSPEQAEQQGLEIDHDDSHALFGAESFGLLIHGTQPKGSAAAKSLAALRAANIDSGYRS